MKTSICLCASIALILVSPIDAIAKPTAAGKIVNSKGSASAQGISGKRTLRIGSSIFKGDTIKTGYTGRVDVLFLDKTKLVIGPRSNIAINEFASISKGNVTTALAIKAARGTFRFLSGNSPKSAYKISTKTATIGIRGTGFDFSYRGRTSVVLYSGSVKVCSGSSCALLTNKCDLAVEQNGRMFKSHSSQLPPGAFKLTFPYIRSENNLSKAYRLKSADCDSGASGGGHKNGGGNSGGGSE